MASLLASCTPPQDRAAPAPLAESQAEPVEAEGARFQAQAFVNPQQATAAFGFDIRGAGVLPLRVSIDNRSGVGLKIIPRQTFLIDLDGQAWPLLTADQASSRLERAGSAVQSAQAPKPDDLDAFTGFALAINTGPGFSSNAQPESRASQGLTAKPPRNPNIPPGAVASGLLFFPGREEAQTARGLRLCYEQGGRLKLLTLPLKASPPAAQ